MSHEQAFPIKAAPLNVTKLEKGDALIAFCNTCMRVIYKGGGRTRISRRVMLSQIEGHIGAFSLPHHIETISTGL